MKKEGVINFPVILLIILGTLTLLSGVYVYFSLNGPDYTKLYLNRLLEGIIKNPFSELNLSNLSIDDFSENMTNDISEDFDLSVIKYLLIEIKAYNLHEILLTNETPKIEIYLKDKAYNAEIIKGEIYVKKGEISEKDFIIRTSLEEISKISSNEKTLEESINSGDSEIEITADKATLLLKGYADLLKTFPKLSSSLN